MIDIDKLRRLAQAVQESPRNIHERVNAIHNLHDALPSGIVLEILDRLEEAESDCLEQARLNGIGAEKELALMAKLEAAEKDIAMKEKIIDALGSALNAVAKERDTLHAKAEAAEEMVRGLEQKLSSGMWRVLREENEAMRARIERMENQKPVAFRWELKAGQYTYVDKPEHASKNARIVPLYLAPGAKEEEK